MNRREGIKISICLAAMALLIVIDQWTKWLAHQYLHLKSQEIKLVANSLYLTYEENTGAAFSILQGQRTWLVSVTGLVLLAMLAYLFLRRKPRSGLMLSAFALILSGGIGNLIDRVFRGVVIDFIDVRIINFAIFNFADICVVCGVILMILYLLLGDRIPQTEETEELPEDESDEAPPADETE